MVRQKEINVLLMVVCFLQASHASIHQCTKDNERFNQYNKDIGAIYGKSFGAGLSKKNKKGIYVSDIIEKEKSGTKNKKTEQSAFKQKRKHSELENYHKAREQERKKTKHGKSEHSGTVVSPF